MKMGLIVFMKWLLFCSIGFAMTDAEIEKLTELRQTVENSALALEQLNQRQNSEITTLIQRKSELQLLTSRDQLQIQVLEKKNDNHQKNPSSEVKMTAADRAVLARWISSLKTWIEESLPLHQEVRLQKVTDLESRLQNHEPPEVLIWDLWSLTENEIKMTKGHQYELINLPIEAETQLSEVARLGMLQAYFKTTGNEFGYLTKEEGQWAFKKTSDKKEKAAIDRILKTVREKQSRVILDLPGLEKGSVQ